MAHPHRRSPVRAVAVPRARPSRWLLPMALLALATALLASVASAQSVVEPTPVDAVGAASEAPRPEALAERPVLLAGPRRDAGLVGVQAAPVAALTPASTVEPVRALAAPADELRQDERPGLRRNVALIAVGLASIAIGSAVDDGAGTVLVLGGAGLSLYGLYQILR